MTKSMCAVAAVLLMGCGLGPDEAGGKAHPSPGLGAIVNWSATGTETDPNVAFNAQFGRTVATNGTSIAVTRLATSSSDLGRTETWLRTSTGWAHNFTWTTTPDRHPVAVLSPNWLIIGEPCVSSTTGCHGRVFTFIWTGTTWFELVQSITTDNAWDYGSALAIREDGGSQAEAALAVTGGGGVNVYSLQTNFFLLIETLTEPTTPYLITGFGSAVAITSAGIAVSAPGGSRRLVLQKGQLASTRSPGFVYVFGANGVTKLTGVGTEGAPAGLGFGASLSASVDGKSIAVGAPTEVGRSLTAYVFRLGTTGAWSLSNAIGPPAGASGTAISVAIDGFLAVTTNAPSSTTAGTLRLFQLAAPPFGTTLDATFALGDSLAPVDLRAGRVIVGDPDFFGDVGSIATYAESAPVISASP
jgi:hypothetical protein